MPVNLTHSQVVELAESHRITQHSANPVVAITATTPAQRFWGFETAPFQVSLTNLDCAELADAGAVGRLCVTVDIHDAAGALLRRIAVRPLPIAVQRGETHVFDDTLFLKVLAGDYELRWNLHVAVPGPDGKPILQTLPVRTRPLRLRIENTIFEMFVELVNACNFRCSFCPQGELVRPQHPMDFELATKIVKDLAEMGHHHPIRTHILGEPLLYKRFGEFVNMAHDHGQRVYLATNGSRFVPEIVDMVIGCRLDEMLISLNTPEESLYNEQRGTNVPYADYIAGITRMVTALVQRGGHTKTRLNVLYDRNKKDDPAEIQRVRGIVDEWIGIASKASGKKLPSASEVVDLVPGGTTVMPLYPGIEMQWTCYHNWGEGSHPPHHFCSFPWRQLGIFVDGQATTCCVDAQGEINLGNARYQTIAEIWNGPQLNRIRQGFMRGQAIDPRCARCDVYHDQQAFFPTPIG